MKYLIYKGTGGLVHMLNGIQESVEICKKENRILIIDTVLLNAFKKNFSEYFFIFDRDLIYYTDYSLVDKNITYKNLSMNQIIEKKAKFNNEDKKYYLENTKIRIHKDLDNEDDSIIKFYAGYSPKYIKNLRLQNHILYNIFDYTYDTIKKYNKYISVHFRNTDMTNDINKFIIKINKFSSIFNINNIYIATDDCKAFDIFKLSLKHLNLFKLTDPENFNGNNIHHHCNDKHKLIINILIDIYMIIKSNYFIPSINSGVSRWIIHQKFNKEDAIFDDDYNFNII